MSTRNMRLVVAMVLMVGVTAQAQTAWFTNTTRTGYWSRGANWTNTTTGATNANLVFAQVTLATNDFDTFSRFGWVNITASGVTNRQSNAANWYYFGNITNTGNGVTLWSINSIFTNATTTIYNTSGRFRLAGMAITNNSILYFAGGGSITNEDNIYGTGSITKNGAGVLILNSVGSYTGDTTNNSGSIVLRNANALTNSTLVHLNTSSTNLIFYSLNNALFGGLAGTANIVLATNASSGGVALRVGNNNADTTYSGILSDNGQTGSLAKVGSGALTLGGVNTYLGTTAISNGVLRLGVVNALSSSGRVSVAGGGYDLNGFTTVTNGAITMSSGAISNGTLVGASYSFSGGSVAAVLAGTGPLTNTAGATLLSGVNTYSGGTFINGGVLRLGLDNALSSAGAVTVAGGGYDLNGLTMVTNGVITMSSGAISNGTLVGSSYVFSGGTAAAVLAGTGALTNNGGTTILSATNTYAGGTVLNAGTLSIGTYSNLPTAGALTFNGGTLQVTGAEIINLNSYGVNWGTFNGGLDVSAGNTLTVADNIGGVGSLTKAGVGTLVLSGLNSYGGGTFLNAGTLSIGSDANIGGANSAITFSGGTLKITGTTLQSLDTHLVNWSTFNGTLDIADAGNTVLISSNISGTSTLTKRGAGAITLAGSNYYSGTTFMYEGAVNLTGSNAWTGTGGTDFWWVRSNSVLNISGYFYGGGQFRVGYESGTTATVNQIDGLVIGAGTYGQLIGNSNPGSVGIYNLYNGTLSNASGSELVLGVNNNTSGNFNMYGGTLFAPTVEIGRNTSGSSVFTTNRFMQNGGVATIGTLYMGGNNSGYTNQISNLIVSNGTLSVSTFSTFAPYANDQAYLYLGTGAVVTLPAFPTLRGANSLTTVELDGGMIIPTASTNKYLQGMNVATISSNGVTFNVSSPAISITVSQNFDNAAGQLGVLTKQGSGTLVLAGTNTYGGSTFVQAGTLSIGSTNALPGWDVNGRYAISSGASLVVANAVSNDWVVTLLAANNFSADARLGFDTTSGDRIYSNTLGNTSAGALGLVKLGANTLTLTEASSYSGGTVIHGGVLYVSNNAALSSGTVVLTNGAQRIVAGDGINVPNDINIYNNGGQSGRGLLESASSGLSTFSGAITIYSNAAAGGHFAGNGSGILNITGPITSSVPVAVRSGTNIFGGGGSYGNLVITGVLKLGRDDGVATNAVVDVATSANATFDLSGYSQALAGLTKNASNTALLTNSAVGPNTLTLNISTGTNFTYAGSIGGPIALVKNGMGTQTLSGANTYTGGTTLGNGVLALSSSTALGSSGTINLNGGTLQFNAGATTDYSSRFSTAPGQAYKINTVGQDVTFATALTSVGGYLEKDGPDVLSLSGANTFDGGISIWGGTLVFRNTAARPATGNVIVSDGTALGLGVGGTGFFSATDVDNLWNNSLDRVIMGASALVGIDTTAGNFSYGTSQSTRGLIKSGANTLTLSGVNTFMGGINVQGGILNVTNESALGGVGGSVMLNGATLQTSGTMSMNDHVLVMAGYNTLSVDGGTTLTVTNDITNPAGMLTKAGAGSLVLSGSNSILALYISANSTLDLGSTGILNINNGASTNIAAPSGGTITNGVLVFNGGSAGNYGDVGASPGTTLTIHSIITGTAGVDYYSGAGTGTVVLTGLNTYSGESDIARQVVSVSLIGNAGASGNLGTNGTINLGSGTYTPTLLYTGNGETNNRVINLSGTTGNVAIDQSGAGVLKFTSDFKSLGAGAKTLTLAGSTTGSGEIAGAITNNTGAVGISKQGTGTWVLSGANNYTGLTTIAAGTLRLGSIAASTNTGAVTVSGGIYDLGAQTAVTNGAITMSSGAISNGTLVGTSYTFSGGSVWAALAGAGSLTNSAGNTTLNGANTFSGGGLVSGGMLTFANQNAKPALGTMVVAAGAGIGLGVGSAGYFTSSDVDTLWAGTMTGITMDPASGVGIDTTAGDFEYLTGQTTRGLVKLGANTLTLSGANTYPLGTLISAGTLKLGSAAATTNSGSVTVNGAVYDLGGFTAVTNGAITANGGTLTNGTLVGAAYLFSNATAYATLAGTASLTNNGGTTLLAAANTYSGGTMIGGGTLQVGTLNAIPVNSAVILGTNNTAANLDLSNYSQTIASFKVASTNATVTNTLTIGAGQTLTVNGNFTVAADTGTNSYNNLKVLGGGALLITNSSAIVSVGMGQNRGNYQSNGGWLDLSALGRVTMGNDVSAISEVRVGYGWGSGGTLYLSDMSNSIYATTLRIGDSQGNNAGNNPAVSTLTLGAGSNVIAVDTIYMGESKASGLLKFASQTPGSEGSVVIKGLTKSGADIVVGHRTATSTGSTPYGLLDLRGHTADVTAGTLTIGVENGASSGSMTGLVYFTDGTFVVSNINMAAKSSTGSGGAFGTLMVSGGVFTVQSGGSFVLASQTGAGSGSVNGYLNLYGGLFNSYVNITDGGGNATSTVTLAGGALDMHGMSIGTAAQNVDVFNLQSGTLMNLGQFNNGASLVKTTTGTLLMTGVNSYSGGTSNRAGSIALGGDNVLGTGRLFMSGGALLSDGTTARTLANDISITTSTSFGDSVSNGLLTLSGVVDFTTGSRGVTNNSDVIFAGGSTNGSINKLGLGTLVIKGQNNWTSATESQNGVLILDGVFTNTDTIRADAAAAGTTATLIISNGASVILNGTTVNLRAGYTGSTSATNIVDIAGYLRIPNANVGSANIFLGGSGGRKGIGYLRTGADVLVRSIQRNNAGDGYGELNFDGGILRANQNNTDFVSNLSTAKVLAGGAVIDSGVYSIGITQPLANGTGGGADGGLTKLGAGTLTLSNNNTYTGPTVISNGIFRILNSDALPTTTRLYADVGAAFDLNGFNQTVGSVADFAGTVSNATGSGRLTVNFNTTQNFYGKLSGTGNLTLTGGGTLRLSGTNDFTTVVTNGSTYAVNGQHTGVITAYSNSMVKGVGSIATLNINGGTYAPGNSIGTQIVASLTLTNAGLLDVELSNTASDQVIVSNSLIVTNGQLRLNLGSYSFAGSGTTYTIVDYQTATGYDWNDTTQWFTLNDSLNGITGPNHGQVWSNGLVFAVSGGLNTTNYFQINYNGLANGDHQPSTITLTAIPEPGTASLLGWLGLAWLARRFHRRRGGRVAP